MSRWFGLLVVMTLGVSASVHAQDAVVEHAPVAEETATPAETATPVETAAPAEPEATPTPPEATPTPPARAPKVAIVIAGDPDPTTIAAARALETVLDAEARITMPSDPAVRAALRGDGTNDGLDDVRSERRHLGLGEARDLVSLTVLGELTSADLVMVVRTSHGAPSATAFDVLRRSFYDGAIALEPIDDAEARHFIVRRARRAARPLREGETTSPRPQPTPSVDPMTAVPAAAVAPDAQSTGEPGFFEQYWPYFAAGALLIGAVVFIVLATQSSSTPPPVLRFEPGGG